MNCNGKCCLIGQIQARCAVVRSGWPCNKPLVRWALFVFITLVMPELLTGVWNVIPG
jgi:hypothetical protein